MSSIRKTLVAATALSFLTGTAAADVTVNLEGVHLCCGGCEKGAAKGAGGIEGAKVTVEKPGRIVIAAKDDAAAQAAIDGLAKAGYHGTVNGSTKVKFPDDSGATKGKKKQKLKVSGFHNCCGSCTNAINKAVAATEGASGEVQKKAPDMIVSGTFDAAELVAKLNAAGYHARVEPVKE